VFSVGAVCTLVSGTDAEGVFRAHLDPCLQTVVRNRGLVTGRRNLADGILWFRVLSRTVADRLYSADAGKSRLANGLRGPSLDSLCGCGDRVVP